MEPLQRVGKPTVQVLQLLLDAPQPNGLLWGLGIIKETGLPSGTVYPMLERLERAGWVYSLWESGDSESRGPRRRLYKLTKEGQAEAKKVCARAAEASKAAAKLRPQTA